MERKEATELSGLFKDAFHPQSFELRKALELLGKDVSRHGVISRSVSYWRVPLIGTAINEVMAGKMADWECEALFGMDWREEGPLGFREVFVAPHQKEKVLVTGMLVLKKDADTIMLLLEPGMDGDVQLRCRYNIGKEKAALDFLTSVDQWTKDHNFYKKAKIDARGNFLDLENLSADDVVLPGDLMRELTRNIHQRIEKIALYEKYNIPTKRGIVLGGEPGTGKTLMGKVLAKTVDCSFVWVTPQHLSDIGSVSKIYEFAREIAPTIVLIEDVDLFCLDRRMGGMHPLLGELLNTLDGVVENKGVITMLSTNYPELLDVALKDRPGRFDTKILIPLPGIPECLKIMQRRMTSMKLAFQGRADILKNIAGQMVTGRLTGAYVVEVLNYAAMLAIERGQDAGASLQVTEKDLMEALQRATGYKALMEQTEKACAGEGILKWGYWQHGRIEGEKE